jgi:hypothetical protein
MAEDVRRVIDGVWRIESARLIAALTRLTRDAEQGRLAHVAPPPPLPPMSPLLPADDSNDVLPSLDRATDTD